MCRKRIDTVEHLFWPCKIAWKVWIYFFPILQEFSAFFRSEGEVYKWERLMNIIKPDEFFITVSIISNLWSHKNAVKANTLKPDHKTIIKAVTTRAKGKVYLNKPAKSKTLSSHRRWAPPANCWKLHTDASWSEENQVGGI